MTTAQIQLLIDDAFLAGGGEVMVPAGTHVLDAPLRLKPRVALRGAGGQTLLTTNDPDTNIIELDPGDDAAAHDVEISNLHMKGPGTSLDISQEVSSDSVKGCGILASTKEDPDADDQVVRNIVIEGCVIVNVSGCGIRFDTREDVLMKDIIVKNCQLLRNRRPPNTGHPDSYKDIYFYGTRFEHIRVEGNTCVFTPNASSAWGNDTGIAFVINQVGRRGCYVKEAHLINNECSGHRRHGIVTNYSSLAAFDVEVRGNICRDNRWMGIYVNTDVEEGKNVTIEDNECTNNGYGGSSDPTAPDKSIRGGIVLNACYNAQINNNRCNDNGHPSTDFDGADASAKDAAGIRVRGKNLVLKGNETERNLGGSIVEWQEHDDSVTIIEDEPADKKPDPSADNKPNLPADKKPDPPAHDNKKEKKEFFLIRFFKKVFGC